MILDKYKYKIIIINLNLFGKNILKKLSKLNIYK